jgi:Bacterial Ig-like domain
MAMFLSPRPRRAQRALGSTTFAAMVLGGAILLAGGPLAPVVSAADPSANIPGIVLPGPVAAGRLGGAIYDVVYRLTVAPGQVVLASLTGAAGTDFDLYLFDSSATTILSTTGLLKKSIGPTSTESISWPSPAGGTYYLDLNGATNVEGDYRVAVQAVPDLTPPVISAVLDGGRPATNQLTVPVTLDASDDLSGVAEMAFSGDGSTYTDWQPFALSTTWTFGAGDGLKTLWVKARNGVGIESAPATATITIDTVQPVTTAIQPPPGSSVIGLRPSFNVTFNKPMDPATWTDLGLIVQSASGDLVPGSYSYDVAARTGTFIPSAPLVPGSTYIVTIGDAHDIAGNPVLPPGSWTIVPLGPTALEAKVNVPAIALGGSARVDISLSGAPPPAVIQVLAAPGSSGAFVALTTLTLVNGIGSLVVLPAMNTTYRLSYEGAFGFTPDVADVGVLVRRSISLVGPGSTVASRAKVGVTVNLTAAISPLAGGVSVSFRLYRFDPVRRAWVYAGSHGRTTNAAGQASATWTPALAGAYYWRASVVSTAQFTNNESPVYRWVVR